MEGIMGTNRKGTGFRGLINRLSIKKDENNARAKNGARDVLLNENTSFHVKEAYKAMRTNVMFSVPEEGCKVIAVTSAFPREGKSTTILNLAITFAQTGSRVLLIDADLRRPNVQKTLDANAEEGLADVLARFATIDSSIKKSQFENLDIFYSGNIPPNPAELLASKNMENLVEELKKCYDYIFIDIPPVNVVTDASVISRLTHGIILVTRQDISKKYEVAEALNKLKFVNAKVLGLVLNDITFQGKGKYGRYGKYKHYYAKEGYSYD
jgi:capsular exopolysaccharide synthesis family protein